MQVSYPFEVRSRVAAVVLLGCALTACTSSSDLGSPAATNPNQAGVGTSTYATGQRPSVPVLSGKTLDGSSLSTATYLGKVLVLNAWASWCEPCQQESPALARIAGKVKPQGIEFVGLDEEDTIANAKAFAAKAGTSYPHLFDEKGDLLASLRQLPTSGIPSTLVLDRQGRVAARVIGVINDIEFEQLLTSIAAEPPTSSS